MKQRKIKKGMAMALVLIILFVVSLIGFALASRGMQTLSTTFQAKQNAYALTAAQAGIANEIYAVQEEKIATPPTTGYTYNSINTPGYLSNETLHNNTVIENQSITANYGLTCTTPITAADGTSVPCGMAYLQSTGAFDSVKKQMKALVWVGDHNSSLSNGQNTVNGKVDGPVRNNLNSGSPSITVGEGGTTAATPDSTPGSIVGNFQRTTYNAPVVPIPNIPVSQIAANCGTTTNGCTSRSCTQIPATSTGVTLNGPGCWYAPNGFTMNGKSGGGFTMTGGAQLFVNGNLTFNGDPLINLSGGEGTPPSSTSASSNNLIVVSGTITGNGATVSSDWNASLIIGGTTANQPDMTLNGAPAINFVGFFYSQQGNLTIPGNLIGNVVANGAPGSTDGSVTVDGNLTTDYNFMNNPLIQSIINTNSTQQEVTPASEWSQ
jgi:Tfp pilus assembly protein PilV